MVYKKVPDFGFSVYEAPAVPRGRRSIRNGKRKRLVEDESPCAFELLAAVAGKLLEESEGSASCNAAAEGKSNLPKRNEKELPRDSTAFKSESFDRGSCAESVFVPEISSKEKNLSSNGKGLLESDINPSPDALEKFDNDFGKGTSNLSVGEPLNLRIGDGSEVLSRDEKYKDQAGSYVNTNSLVTSECSVKLPLYRKPTPNSVKLGIRDDDENSIGCNSTRIRPFRPQPRLGQRRMRKVMPSRYWKAGMRRKGYGHFTASERMKAFYGDRKGVYARCQQAPNKKRTSFDHRFSAAYDSGDTTNNSIPNVPGKVSLRIKSFKVPELYLEMPESATVGSLKKTVLEAITTILRGGIRVGIFFQGKKVGDDNRTLHQTGISQFSNLDNLGFALESSVAYISSANTEAFHADLGTPRSLYCPVIEPQTVVKLDDTATKEVAPFPKVREPDDVPVNGDVAQAMALVPVSPMKMEALAEVDLNPKPPPKCTEASHRRTRRPFSVAEVEALIEAVETLGTGRWRDVKMRAFETADHRTYVDLKDKWKTLVHTASISPQQRRGEPVPHELLNRVLLAHSYWSQHPSKQHKKPPPPVIEPPKIEEGVVAVT